MNMPLVLLNRRRRGAFNPAYLFALAEPGVWYDPSDLTTLFQDNAGTTPVTTPGQTVGLMLDKSKGLVLGSELVTNGTFDSGTTGWTTIVASQAVVGGELQVTSASSTYGSYQTITVEANKSYKISLNSRAGTGNPYVNIGNGGALSSQYGSGLNGNISRIIQSTSTSLTITLGVVGTATAFFDNISVKLLAGNHATQATSTQRPTYGINPIVGTRNLLTYTEQFDNAAWLKLGATVTTNTTTAPDGTATADTVVLGTVGNVILQDYSTTVNGTYVSSVYLRSDAPTTVVLIIQQSGGASSSLTCSLTTSWQRFEISKALATLTFVRTVLTTNSNTPTFYAWGAQLELGSTATAYQKVVSQYEVTQAGVQSVSYLAFDGVDDGMVTNTITPGTDKVQVFAGVRKLSDAATATLLELGTGGATGSFLFAAPLGTSEYQWRTQGTVAANALADAAQYAAPNTSVLTGIGNISGPTATIRVNGVQAETSSATQGTGNYLAYPLYIGRRGGSSLPYNGRLYSLITRFGPNLTDGQIASTESWVNAKVGAY